MSDDHKQPGDIPQDRFEQTVASARLENDDTPPVGVEEGSAFSGAAFLTSEACHGLIVLTVLFAVYLLTMPLKVGLADSGLFLMASHFFGVAHPPGYPLHTILGHLAASIPIGDIPFRVHLVSAMFGAATCSMVWMVSRRLSLSILASYTAAMAFGVSAAFWSQAIIAEVYTLNTFLFFLLLNLVMIYRDSGGRSMALWMALIFGLSLSNHWPLMLLAAPCFLIIAWPRRIDLLRQSPKLTALFAIGLFPYINLVVRSHADPILNFYGPLKSLEWFWYFVSRQGYLPTADTPSAGLFDGVQFSAFVTNEMISQFTLVGFAVAVVGIWQLKRHLKAAVFWALGWAVFSNSFLLVLVLKSDFDFMTQSSFKVIPLVSYGVLALALGAGADWLLQPFKGQKSMQVVGFGICSLLVAVIFASHFEQNYLRDYDFAEDMASTVLESLEQDAVIITSGDMDTLPIGFLHHVEGVRPDVTIYNFDGLVFNNRILSVPYTAHMRMEKWQDFLQSNRRPAYSAGILFQDLDLWDYGLYRRIIVEAENEPVMPPFPDRLLEFLDRTIDRRPTDPQTIRARNILLVSFAIALNRYGLTQADPGELERILPYIEKLDPLIQGKLGKAIAGYGFQEAGTLMALMDERQLLNDRTLDNWTLARFYSLRGLLHIAMENEEAALSDWRRSAKFDPYPQTNKAMENILKHHYTKRNRQEFDFAKELYFPNGLPPSIQEAAGEW